MELNSNNTNRNAAGCSKPLKACSVIVVVCMLAVIGLLIYAMQLKPIRIMLKCRNNITEVGAALDRYHTVNGEYPPDLETLKKEYLKDPNVLKCPLDKSSGDKSSYIYNRPSSSSKDTFVILECDRHKASRDLPPSKLKLMVNGEFWSPSFSEAMKEASKQKK